MYHSTRVSYLDKYTRNRELLYETPRDIPVKFPLDRTKLRAVFNTMVRLMSCWLEKSLGVTVQLF